MSKPFHPFKQPCSRATAMLAQGRQVEEERRWRGISSLLRRNPSLIVFFVHDDVLQDHGCMGGRTTALRFEWQSDPGGALLMLCMDCERVGVTWDVDWRVPSNLAEVLNPLLRRFENPRAPASAEAPCPHCGHAATVKFQEGQVLVDGSLDYSIECQSCRTKTACVGRQALREAEQRGRPDGDQPTRSNSEYRSAAQEMYHDEGHVEVDDDARVARFLDGGGAYVEALVQVLDGDVVGLAKVEALAGCRAAGLEPKTSDAVAPTGYEAECTTCGETFNPDGPDDLEHLTRKDGRECGGAGVMRGWWA